ncbi:DUF3239 domain-containing protein [Anatilimnocola floriformis]|uniref:DUF3239 domain-containing protein n=1 Tax=Anatilimnocola floriformis TaxID=2948575 RepID=UPI0020C34319|nr:DUF3239 domain-containing protein [Anatilimnocola floriformis]
MAGQSAQCTACQQVVVVPYPNAPAIQPSGWAPPQPPDQGIRREVEQFNRETNSAASNPGMLRMSMLKYLMSFPKWPIIWMSLLLISLLLGYFTCFGWIMAVLFLVMNIGYWRVTRNKFVAGCINPGVVVSLDPPLVAVLTNLNKGGSDTDWNYIRILNQPLNSMTGGPPQIGQRLAAVALYTPSDDACPHWEYFSPTVVNCVTWNAREIQRVQNSIEASDWDELSRGLKQLPQPPAEGLFKVELKPPRQRSLSPHQIAQALPHVVKHLPDKYCYLAAHGIPPQILQTALPSIAPSVNPHSVLALVLANSDASGKRGMIMTGEGIFFHVSDTLRGAFRWQDLWGAGYSRYQFELLLINGQRWRFDEAFGENSQMLETLLDGISKSG